MELPGSSSFREWSDRYYRNEHSRTVRFWGASGAGVVCVVGGIFWWGLMHSSTTAHVEPSPAPLSAIAIDMTPLPAVAPTPTQDVPPGMQQQAAPQDVAPEEKPVVEAPSAPVKHPPVPVPIKKPLVPHRKPHHKRQPRPVLSKDPKASEADRTTAPPAADAAPVVREQAPSQRKTVARNSTSPATWQGDILARLEQCKRYPAQAQNAHQEGVSSLFFIIDRQGHVVQAHLQKGSGFALLDEETMALVHRADPFPPPPDAVSGDTISMTVPISFSMSDR